MQKIIQVITLIIIVAWLGVSVASVNSGINYLNSQQQLDGSIGGLDPNGWAVMALGAQNQRNQKAVDALKEDQCALSELAATDIEKQILALEAAGENPRTFAGCNAVAALNARITGDGIGSGEYLNDDMFGILALKAAKEPVPGEVITNLIASQNTDGGWGLTKGGQSSTDMTAMAFIALEGTGLTNEAKTKALDYLRSKQNTDGGFATFSGETNLASTAWVDWMIATLGQSESAWVKNGNTPRSYIANQQLENGSWLNGVLVTSYSLIALSGKGMPIYGVAAAPSPSPAPSVTLTPSPLPSVTSTPSPTPSVVPSIAPSPIVSPSPQPSPVASVSPTISSTPIPSPTETHAPDVHPSPTHTASTHTPTASPSAMALAIIGVPTPSPSPSLTSSSPSPSPSPSPIASPVVRRLLIPPFVRSQAKASPSPVIVASPSPMPSPVVTTSSLPVQPTLQQEIAKPYGVQILIGFILLFLNILATIYELYRAEKRVK